MLKRLKQALFPASGTKAQVMFYASSVIDELWVRTTALAMPDHGVDCCIAVSRGTLEPGISASYAKAGIPVFYDAGRAFLQKCNVQAVVTASSGLPADWFSPSVKWRIHMPHSIASLHMIYTADCFDGYNMLFAVGPHHRVEFDALSAARKLPGRPVIAAGYGKLDVLQAAKPLVKAEAGKPLILLAPSWGASNILNTIGSELIAGLLNAGYSVILRPHPLFFIENDPLLPRFEKQFAANGNFAIESSLGFGQAIFNADLLVTDYSGTAQEFAALRGDPVVFIDVPKKILNPDWEEFKQVPVELRSRGILGPLVQPDAAAVVESIGEVLAKRGDWTSRIENFIPEFLYNRNCAGAASAALSSLIKGARPEDLAA